MARSTKWHCGWTIAMIPARRRRSTVLSSAAFARSGVAFAKFHHVFARLAFIFVEFDVIKYFLRTESTKLARSTKWHCRWTLAMIPGHRRR